MLKFEINREKSIASLEASGTGVEICAELLGVIRLVSKNEDIKEVLLKSLNDDEFWKLGETETK